MNNTMNRKITGKQAEEVRTLYKDGVSIATIARVFQISTSRVYQLISHKEEVAPPVVYSSGDW